MKVAAIIAEYNPFHKGHAYHIEQTKKLTGADYIVVLMSGSFTQRGIPACLDKYTRAQCAQLCGADLVLELPFAYATGSAEYFAEGAVSILHRLGCVDFLSFGVEGTTSVPLFMETASFFCEEPEAYKHRLKELLRQGLSFPSARQKAAEGLLSPEALALLSTPNALLGLEYCKALLRLQSPIAPVLIKREGADYHDVSILTDGFSSATALRALLQKAFPGNSRPLGAASYTVRGSQNKMQDISFQTASSEILSAFLRQLPDSCAACFLPPERREEKNTLHAIETPDADNGEFLPVFMEDFYPYLSYLARMFPKELAGIWEISAELAARIGSRTSPCSYEDWLAGIKSKQYTRTRIERGFLHLLLHLTNEDVLRFRPFAGCCAGYARILGFRKNASPLLSRIKETAVLPILTKLAQKEKRCNDTELCLLSYDIAATDLYRQVVYQKYGVLLPDEYSYILIND